MAYYRWTEIFNNTQLHPLTHQDRNFQGSIKLQPQDIPVLQGPVQETDPYIPSFDRKKPERVTTVSTKGAPNTQSLPFLAGLQHFV